MSLRQNILEAPQEVVLSLLIILGTFSAQVSAFSCYKCTSNENAPCEGELNPVELPPSVSVVDNCDGYCTIVRTEFTDIPGEIVTLVRDCESEPLVLNDVRTDKHYTKMYTSCQQDRCNSGDGSREPGQDGSSNRRPSSLYIVPESSAAAINPCYLLISILFYFCLRLQ